MEDLRERVNFMEGWVDGGIPPAFWISGFYFPQAFLTGTLQNYARKYIVSIDTISFTFKILNEKPTARPTDGCNIYGLFLEGARFDSKSGVLAESKPKELYTGEFADFLYQKFFGFIESFSSPRHALYLVGPERKLRAPGARDIRMSGV